MKLKTLKDLGMKYLKPPISETGYCMGRNIVDKRELKQEAIKRVKWARNQNIENIGVRNYKLMKKILSAEGFIFEFFNITEEDLK